MLAEAGSTNNPHPYQEHLVGRSAVCTFARLSRRLGRRWLLRGLVLLLLLLLLGLGELLQVQLLQRQQQLRLALSKRGA